MKAVVYTQYGPPEVLTVAEVDKPRPTEHEILVKVHATTVTPTDCAFRKADPLLVRLMQGLLRPKTRILGNVLAGEIEAVGSAVRRFRPGDAVVGSTDTDFGAHAAYKCLRETGVVTKKPSTMSYAEAAGLPEALTGLYFLRDLANLRSGQRVLINGAAGAVGSYAVQLACHFGAEVTGVCSTKNVALVRSLGADQVIDYTQADFTQTGQTYDVIFDAVGKSSFTRCKGALTQGGVYLVTVPGLRIMLDTAWTAMRGTRKARLGFAGLQQRQADLEFVAELAEAGKVRSVVDRQYRLEDIVEAYRYVETGHKTGNVVIMVAPPSASV